MFFLTLFPSKANYPEKNQWITNCFSIETLPNWATEFIKNNKAGEYLNTLGKLFMI